MPTTSRSLLESVVLVIFGALLGSSSLQSLIFGHGDESTTSATAVSEPKSSHDHAPRSLTYLDESVACPLHMLDIHIFSQAPLIVYISNFLSQSEADELVDLAYVCNTSESPLRPRADPKVNRITSQAQYMPMASRSTLQYASLKKVLCCPRLRAASNPTDYFVPPAAELPRTRTVKCIEHRALDIQGWPQDTFVERLSLQRYKETGFYGNHYDWATANRNARRTSTFMVYVFANCTGCGTNFPLLSAPADRKWCEFIDCDADPASGVTFLPNPRAAVYWQNFDGDGRGWKEGLHAGLPVTQGVKIGLNIWSWYQRGHKRPVGTTGD